MTNVQVFNMLIERKIAKAVVYYSGGGDEGGVDDISLQDADGNEISKMVEYNYSCVRDAAGNYLKDAKGDYVKKPLTPDQALNCALCKPVYDKYGSFAGEFHVSGRIIWDATKFKVIDG